jgi:hypothetical protein
MLSYPNSAEHRVFNEGLRAKNRKKNCLLAVINHKKRELNRLVIAKMNIQDPEVYRKSCELDVFIVNYMRSNNLP